MAFINLSSNLVDPAGGDPIGNLFRFTHVTTTGQTVAGFIQEVEVEANGFYDVDVQYGNVIVSSKDLLACSWTIHGTITINSDTPATDIPSLLGITTPATDADLLVFQALAADASDSAVAADLSATEAAASALNSVLLDSDQVIDGIKEFLQAIGGTLYINATGNIEIQGSDGVAIVLGNGNSITRAMSHDKDHDTGLHWSGGNFCRLTGSGGVGMVIGDGSNFSLQSSDGTTRTTRALFPADGAIDNDLHLVTKGFMDAAIAAAIAAIP